MFPRALMCLSELLIINSGDAQCLVPGLGALCSLLLEGDCQVTTQGEF